MKRYLVLILMIIVVLVGCKKQITNPDDVIIPELDGNGSIEEDPIDGEVDIIRDKISKMSIEEKIGQLLIVGLDSPVISEHEKTMIEEYKIGGFILFARNMKDDAQSLNLINDLKSLNSNNRIPLFISIDEEGGIVSRLPKTFRKLPDAKVLGDLNDLDISYEYGQIIGERLKKLGINLDFAPVLDINSNPKNPVIGRRAFGNKADIVIDNGIAVLKGVESTGVIPSPKHFPGHGDTGVDSHVNLPRVNKTLEELKRLELQPFISAIDEGVDMIMVAHILYPELDPVYPSTMSKTVLTDLLRLELGFDGVIISDDLTMGAIVENYTLEVGALEFLKAGGDIALVCHGNNSPIIVIESIKEYIASGKLTIEEIDEKLYRILRLKEKYNLNDDIIEGISLNDINKATDVLLKKISK